MNKFFTLYKKELRGSRNELIIMLSGIIAWAVYIVSKSGWPVEAKIALWAGPVFSGIAIWYAVTSFTTLASEWRQNSQYWLMSFPVRPVVLLGAKLLNIIIRATVLGTLAIVITYFLLDLFGLPLININFSGILGIYFYLVLPGMLLVSLMSFASYLAAKTIPKFGWLLGIVVYGGLNWLSGKVTMGVGNVLGFMPTLHFNFDGGMGIKMSTSAGAVLNMGTSLAMYFTAALILLLSAWIFDRFVEV